MTAITNHSTRAGGSADAIRRVVGAVSSESAPLPRPPIQLGIVGTGLAAKRLHWPALAVLRDRFAVTAFANRTRATAEEFAGLAGLSMQGYYADYRDLLSRADVEAVLVSVPIPQLLSIARDCLDAGKHLLCEKPPGATEAEAHEFVSLVGRYPRQKILMAEHFFYRDDLRLARSLVDGGAIGEIRLQIARVIKHEVPAPGAWPSTPWRTQPAYRGGSLLDGGVHDVAGIRLLGGDLSTISARTEWLNPTFAAPSVLAATFGFASGTTGNLFYGSFENPVLEEGSETQLYGTSGSLVVTRGRVRVVHSDGRIDDCRIDGGSGFYNEFRNFYDAIVFDEPIVGTVEQSLRNMFVVLRALDSAEQNRPIDLASLSWNQPAAGVPLWRPRGASGLFAGLPAHVTVTNATAT